MKRAAVTGAGGFIGGHLTAALQAAGWQVSKVARADLEAPDLSNVDVLFHLAGLAHAGAHGADREQMFAVNVQQTLALYRLAVAAGVQRFVWLSSIKVLGDEAARPLPTSAPRRPGDVYAQSKAAAEETLLDETPGATALCIVRPPLVYGAGVGANFLSLLRAAASPWPLPLKSATAPRAWLGVRNLVDLLSLLATCPDAAQQTIWHARDAEESSVCEMLSMLRQALGVPARLWPVAPGVAMQIGRALGRADTLSRLFRPLRVDMSETETLLGWRPPHSQHDELAGVVAWYRTR